MPVTLTDQRRKIYAVAFIGVALLIYSIVRAVTVCLTTDEAFSYLVYAKRDLFFLPTYDYMGANFHILNTWGMILGKKIFGSQEWSLRLPNLLAHAMYLYFTARFALKSNTLWNTVAVFILLNVHPYLLDFFSVARGYGISFGMLAGSLWFLSKYVEERRISNLIFSLLFAGCAMWASFVMLNVFAAVSATLGLVVLLSSRELLTARQKIMHVSSIAAVFALFTVPALPILFRLRETAALEWGTDQFWDVSVRGLADLIMYNPRAEIYLSGRAPGWGVMIFLLFVAGIVIYAITRKPEGKRNVLVLAFTGILGISLVSMYVQHVVMDTPYPFSRTGLYLFVLLIFALAVSLRDFAIPKKVSAIYCLILVPVQLFVAIPDLNVRHTAEWTFCEDIDTALDKLMQSEFVPDAERPGIILACDVELFQVVSYYLTEKGLQNVSLCMVLPGTNDRTSDYYLLSIARPHPDHAATDTIINYPASALMLLRNKEIPLVQSTIYTSVNSDDFLCSVQKVSDVCALFSYKSEAVDTVQIRLNCTVDLKFADHSSEGLFVLAHIRDGNAIWSTWIGAGATADSLQGRRTVSLQIPGTMAPGDELIIDFVPVRDLDGAIEISHLNYSVRGHSYNEPE